MKSLLEYINGDQTEPAPDVAADELQDVPRRNSLEEAERMTEAAKKRGADDEE